MRDPDRPSLAAGVAVLALGVVLLLDAVDALRLSFAVLAPIVLAAVGATLLVSGLSRDS